MDLRARLVVGTVLFAAGIGLQSPGGAARSDTPQRPAPPSYHGGMWGPAFLVAKPFYSAWK